MDEKKYVAYVGTYTHGNSVGIHLFDLDRGIRRSPNKRSLGNVPVEVVQQQPRCEKVLGDIAVMENHPVCQGIR